MLKLFQIHIRRIAPINSQHLNSQHLKTYKRIGFYVCYLYLLYLLIIGTLEERLQIYEEVSKRHPRAVSPRRLPLNFVSGNKLHICSVIIVFCLFFSEVFIRLFNVYLIPTCAFNTYLNM